MNELEWNAKHFAIEAHNRIGQKRKYTHEPYWKHPEAVAAIVRTVPHTEEMLTAAWLHDVVEDTGVPIQTIEKEFGLVVACYVEQLTDVSKESDGSRAERKAIDAAHTARACREAKTVKLADLIDNSRSILKRDPSFARVYLKEKAVLLQVLKEGDATLWAQADDIVTMGLELCELREVRKAAESWRDWRRRSSGKGYPAGLSPAECDLYDAMDNATRVIGSGPG